MKRIVQLVEQKNHYLEKFLTLNETEITNFAIGHFDQLDAFYQKREGMLKVIRYIDQQLEAAQQAMDAMPAADDRRSVREQLSIKDEYVARIIEQDLQILSMIENAKNTIIKELQSVKKNRKAIGGYKAFDDSTGLDEEA